MTIAPWLTQFFTLADVPDRMLHLTLAGLTLFRRMPRERAAIAHELAVRAWADAVVERLSDRDCVWTCRGGRS